MQAALQAALVALCQMNEPPCAQPLAPSARAEPCLRSPRPGPPTGPSGVVQMNAGVVLSFFNQRYFADKLSTICEFVPQVDGREGGSHSGHSAHSMHNGYSMQRRAQRAQRASLPGARLPRLSCGRPAGQRGLAHCPLRGAGSPGVLCRVRRGADGVALPPAWRVWPPILRPPPAWPSTHAHPSTAPPLAAPCILHPH